MENFTGWHIINLLFIPLNLWLAIDCFKDKNNFAGHLNMAAVAINAIVIANVVTR